MGQTRSGVSRIGGRTARLALCLLAAAPAAARAGAPPSTLSVAGLGRVAVYAPAGAPREVVLFVSGDGGWNLGVVAMAERLRDEGALVAGIDIRSFNKTMEAGRACAYPAGALEELSRSLQLERHLRAYQRPLLVGYSSGATLVYAALAAAPPETFAGAISLGFCPDLEIHKAPCRLRGLSFTPKKKGVGYDLAPDHALGRPWVVLQGESDQVCPAPATRAFVSAVGAPARLVSLPKVGHGFSVTRNWDASFVEAFRGIAAARPGAEPRAAAAPGIEDLSLVELPATGAGDLFAVMLTGDGGWADIDKGVSAGLTARGVPVVGWSSLGYYWTPRTPEGAAADLHRIVEHYAAAWGKPRVLLVGYSFGADVLPFLVNRLPAADAARVAGVALLGLSAQAAFEFHVTSWIGRGSDPRYPTASEIARLRAPTLCVKGADEDDSACGAVGGGTVRVQEVGSGHHFGGDYARLAQLALATAGR
jgi:type IV secretory pathway VirJ component